MTTEVATPEVEKEEKERDYAMVSISVPHGLHKQLEEQAEAQNPKVSLSVFVRRLVAGASNFDITSFERSRRRGRVKYATQEERDKAQRDRAATVKALMERYNKGEISISDEELATAAASIKPRKSTAKAS